MNLNFTLIIEALSFTILVFILTKLLYRPLLRLLDERKALIHKSIDEARRMREETQRGLEESKKILQESKDEALKIKDQANIEAQELKIENLQETKKQTRQIMDEANRTLNREIDSAKQQIKKEVADISIQLAQKMLKREVDQKDHDRLIEKAIKELGDGST